MWHLTEPQNNPVKKILGGYYAFNKRKKLRELSGLLMTYKRPGISNYNKIWCHVAELPSRVRI